MVVLILTACPAGLRGHLTRWLLEISPGVFIGRVTTRIRDELWTQVLELCKDGKAIMIFTAHNEQGLDFRVHRHDWEPIDLDGLTLIRRPHAPNSSSTGMRKGWSNAAKRRHSKRST